MKPIQHQRYLNYIPKEEMVKNGEIRMDIVIGGTYRVNDEVTFINGLYANNVLKRARIATIEPLYMDKSGVYTVIGSEQILNVWNSEFVNSLALEYGLRDWKEFKFLFTKLHGLQAKMKYQVIRW